MRGHSMKRHDTRFDSATLYKIELILSTVINEEYVKGCKSELKRRDLHGRSLVIELQIIGMILRLSGNTSCPAEVDGDEQNLL